MRGVYCEKKVDLRCVGNKLERVKRIIKSSGHIKLKVVS